MTTEENIDIAATLATADTLIAKIDGKVRYWTLDVQPRTASLNIQAYDQADIKTTRALFPGTVWSKRYNEGASWWEYIATVEGLRIQLYACREAPPTCRQVEEEYEDTEEILPDQAPRPEPAYRKVKKTRFVWVCDGGPE